MGSWKVKKVSETAENYDLTDVSKKSYGNNVRVKFEMKYSKNSSGEFEEMPPLEWIETITFVDHEKREWWTFNANMYDHNRGSRTLRIWPRRYIAAYNATKDNYDDPFVPGSSVLFKKVPLLGYRKVKDLPNVTEDDEKTQVVQEYLRKHGGKLEIEIIDRPSLGYPTDGKSQVNVERMLLFDVGLQNNSSQRWNGYQHVKLDQAHPESWIRDVKSGSPNTDPLPPDGYVNIGALPAVTRGSERMPVRGEVW